MSDAYDHVVAPGMKVEVITVEPGRVNAYYPATCVQVRGETCRVQHDSKKDANGFRLIEDVPLDMVRPDPPTRRFSQLVVGDIVDCKNHGVWFKCKVSKQGPTENVQVAFDYPALSGCLHRWMAPRCVRVHQEWNRHPGEWVCTKDPETEYATESQGSS